MLSLNRSNEINLNIISISILCYNVHFLWIVGLLFNSSTREEKSFEAIYKFARSERLMYQQLLNVQKCVIEPFIKTGNSSIANQYVMLESCQTFNSVPFEQCVDVEYSNLFRIFLTLFIRWLYYTTKTQD